MKRRSLAKRQRGYDSVRQLECPWAALLLVQGCGQVTIGGEGLLFWQSDIHTYPLIDGIFNTNEDRLPLLVVAGVLNPSRTSLMVRLLNRSCVKTERFNADKLGYYPRME
jgi:hypothetical protein